MSKPDLLSTLGTDVKKLETKLLTCKPSGKINFVTSVRIAHLALKHRMSKNQRMRIVVFVGSQIAEDEKELIKLGKKLKKEKVNIDVINFGEVENNSTKLTALIDTVNGAKASDDVPASGMGSHVISVPPGSSLTESLSSSPVIVGEDGRGAMVGAGVGMDFVDPNEDPDLALALRVSMEHQRAQQEQEQRQQQQQGGGAELSGALGGAGGGGIGGAESSEDALLQQALAMSMGEYQQGQQRWNVDLDAETIPVIHSGGGPGAAASGGTDMDFMNMTEEEQIALALRLSMAPQEEAPAAPAEPEKMDTTEATEPTGTGTSEASRHMVLDIIQDPEFLNTLPGVDASSAEVQQAINEDAQAQDDEDKKKTKSKKDEKK